MYEMVKDDAGPSGWTFAKLTGPSTWSDWSRNMEFSLLDANLWGNVNGDRLKPTAVGPIAPDTDKWDSRDAKARGKIGLMCNKTVQLQLKSIWTAKETWDYLKKICTPGGWSNKWELMSKVRSLSLAKCKDIADFHGQLGKLKAEVTELKISIEDYFVIKAVDSLDQRFETWITYLVQQARDSKDGKLPDFDTIFQNLQQEEHRQKTRNEQFNLAHGGGGRRGRGRGRGGGHQGHQDHNHDGNNHTGNQESSGGRGGTQGRGGNRGRESRRRRSSTTTYLQEYARTANVVMETRHATTVANQVMDGDVASTIIREIARTLPQGPQGTAINQHSVLLLA
jgi:hypothetical protein